MGSKNYIKIFFQSSIKERQIVLLGLLLIVVFMPLNMYFNQTITYQTNYFNVAIHTVVEMLVILLTLTISLQGWLIYPYHKSGKNVVLSGLFLPVGLFLFLHILFYEGMPLNEILNSEQISIFFSILSRVLEALGIVFILFMNDSILDKLKRNGFYIFSLLLVVVIGFFVLLTSINLPTFSQNSINFAFLINKSKIILFLHIAAWIKLFYNIASNRKSVISSFIFALTFLIFSDIVFLLGKNLLDLFSLLGHGFKLIGYYFIFNTNYLTTVEIPFIQKRLAEEESFENKQQLNWMLELIPGAFHTVDANFIITSANSAFHQLFGEKEENLIGQSIIDLLIKNGVELEDIPCVKAVTEGQPLIKEKIKINQQIFQTDVIPIIDKTTSRVVGAAAYCFDITKEEAESNKQKILLEEYLHQTQNLHHLIEAIPISFLAIDKNGIVIHANELSLSFINFESLDELIGANLDQMAIRLNTSKEKLFIYNALQGKEIINTNGKINNHEMLVNAYPIRSRMDNSILGAIALYQDVTELQILRSEMENIERLNLVGQMAASITHEIRNPMAAVRGFIQLIKEDSSKKQEYYDIIIDELDRANSIINDFLFLSHKRVIEVKEYNINNIIKEIYPILLADANIKGQYVELVLDDNVEKLILNKKEMKQLILNLARNAFEAMTDGGILKLTTHALTDGVELRISDTGYGVPKDKLDKLFIPFFTTKDGGTGLGLSVSKSIIEKHNGEIHVESEEGIGTTFIIYFRY